MKKRWYPEGKRWVLLHEWDGGSAVGLYSSKKNALADAAKVIKSILDEAADNEDVGPSDPELRRLIAAGDHEALLDLWNDLWTDDSFTIQQVTVDKPIDPEEWF